MAKKRYIIGVDAGTSQIKAVLFDLGGGELTAHAVPIQIESPSPDTAEQDMGAIWGHAVDCIRQVARELDPEQCAGIGITAQGDGTWMIDAAGEPVRPGISWCDGRAAQIVESWHGDGTARRAFDRCGTAVNTGTQACQIAWLKQHEPQSLQRARTIFHCKDWIHFKLTGQVTTDQTDESLPMLNMASRQYDDELFAIFALEDLRARFPKVLPAGQNIAGLSAAGAAALGLPEGMPVGSGPMDVAACALGVGAIGHGDGSTVLGTAGIHQVTMDKPDLTPQMVGMTLCHAPQDRWLRLMATNSATPNLEWVLRHLGRDFRKQADQRGAEIFDVVDEAITAVPIGSRGVMYLPYLLPNGERAPFIKPSAKAGFCGLSESHGLADLMRAVYEGVTLAMVDCYEHMPIKATTISLSGGGTRSEPWCQMIADAMGAAIRVPAGTEFGAKGAAMNLAVGTGLMDSYKQAVSRMVAASKSYEPDLANHAIYQKFYPLYRKLAADSGDYWDLRARILQELG